MHKKGKKKIVLTGGGSAGHVIPNLALIPKLKEGEWEIYYIGSKHGLEKDLLASPLFSHIPYFVVSSGKLRRCFSWHNFLAPLKTLWGIIQALILCCRFRPNLIFSKGGFVSLPVVIAAWLSRIPVLLHESDLTPGLANRLSFPFVKKIYLALSETEKYISSLYNHKILVTGIPMRTDLVKGDAELGKRICSFSDDKGIILVQGGGLGSDSVNKLIRELLPKLLPHFQIIHICGRGKIDINFNNLANYQQFEYLESELPHLLACTDLIISRAGANSIYELIALKKPHILLPLSQKESRGEQLLNAKYWVARGLSRVIYPDELTTETLYQEVCRTWDNLTAIKKTLAEHIFADSAALICQDIALCVQ